MSEHHNQYRMQEHHHQQHSQHQMPYSGRVTNPKSHHPQHHPQQRARQPQQPHRPRNHTLSSSDSTKGNGAIEGNKRSAASMSPPTSGTASPTANISPATAEATPKSNKKAKKSSSRSSPNGDGASVKSTGTNAKGLRHFSMMVCQKVEEKGTTTYNEVADELVKKVVAEKHQEDPSPSFDQKNIRRRVYDALNVLMAMDIISKEKKEITWKGLPTAAKQDMETMSKEIDFREDQIAQKKEALRELLTQQICFRNLVLRNHQREISGKYPRKVGVPDEKIPFPFLIVNTDKSAEIQCDMSVDRTDVMFNFSLPFGVKDDNAILKGMQMDRTSMSDLRQMFPGDLLKYCECNGLLDALLGRGSPQQASESPSHSSRHHYSYHQHHQVPAPSVRGGLSIGGSSSGSSSRLERVSLHDHHFSHYQAPPPSYHAYEHHGRAMGIPPRTRQPTHPHHQHHHPFPPMVGSSVSSSRRSSGRDRYAY